MDEVQPPLIHRDSANGNTTPSIVHKQSAYPESILVLEFDDRATICLVHVRDSHGEQPAAPTEHMPVLMTPHHREDAELFRHFICWPRARAVVFDGIELLWSYSHPEYGAVHPTLGELTGPNIDTVLFCAGLAQLWRWGRGRGCRRAADICAGSGFIGQYIACRAPAPASEGLMVALVDLHEAAPIVWQGLAIADRLGSKIEYSFHICEACAWCTEVAGCSIDLLCCNPPYIPTSSDFDVDEDVHTSGSSRAEWACGVWVLCDIIEHGIPWALSRDGVAVVGLSSLSLTVSAVCDALEKLTIDGFRLSVLNEREVPLMLDWSHVPRESLQTGDANHCWRPSNDCHDGLVDADSGVVKLLVGGTLMPRFEYNAARARACGAYRTSYKADDLQSDTDPCSGWFSCWHVYYCLAIQRDAKITAHTPSDM